MTARGRVRAIGYGLPQGCGRGGAIIVALALTILSGPIACAATNGGAGGQQSATGNPPVVKGAEAPQTQAEAAAYAEFRKRVDAYVEMQKRVQGTVPQRPKDATPEVIDRHQRALAAAIQQERATAKAGDIFVPEAATAMKAVLARVFGGPDGKQLKASIMDENPGPVKVTVNGRYPDEVPLSTVPPQVLASLPKLPTTLEYRFVGDTLVLLDVQAHIVIDYIEDALPA